MKLHSRLFIALSVLIITLSKANAQNESSNYTWMVWEQRHIDPVLCQVKSLCTPQRNFITRLIEQPTEQKAREMLSSIDQLAKLRGQVVEHPDTPKICQHTEAGRILGFDPELWKLSDKLSALTGLQGVYFSVESLKAPVGYSGSFGKNLQLEMGRRFQEAGLSVLTEDQMANTPGKPHLNIYFSNTNPNTGCTYSIFASLTQTMLLTRNHSTKLKVGTWGMSGGHSADHPNGDEYDAIMRVVDRFLDDYRRANLVKY